MCSIKDKQTNKKTKLSNENNACNKQYNAGEKYRVLIV